MNVPLIIASPSLERGAVVDSTVRTIDILPTMLEIAAPEHLESSALQGKSLLSFAYGDRASRDTYAEGMLYGPSERSLISDGFKLLYDAGRDRYALYDTRQDPDEAEDLASTQPERLRQMREALEAQIELLKASSLTLTAGRAEERAAAPLPESVEAALQALGYTE